MANLAQSAVTITRSWSEGGINSKDLSCRRVSLVLTGQGTTTNKITAAVLGLSYIESCTAFVKSDSAKIYPAVPAADGLSILLLDETQATDANRANPADITATVVGTVKGFL